MRSSIDRSTASYSREQVGDLIALATRLDDLSEETPDGRFTAEQVIQVAAELGISAAAVHQAMADHKQRTREHRRTSRRRVRRQMRFLRHLTAFVAVTLGLFLIDAVNGGGWWFYYVAALWGVFVALHGLRFVTGRRGPLERYLLARGPSSSESVS